MTDAHRVIVTRNNAAGKSSVLQDKRVEPSGVGVFNFWQTFQGRAPGDLSGQDAEFKFFPDVGGTQFRLFTIPPEDRSEHAPKVNPDDFFKHIGWSGARRDTTRHPLMHVTPTVDYILLLSGEISLLLEEGEPVPLKPFDAVVQRGTNHWWLNTGTTAALLMAVMVGQ